MKKKGEKLPAIEVEGKSDAVVKVVNGRIVKVCGVCDTELERSSGQCPNAASH